MSEKQSTDPEVLASKPKPCQYCGKEWERWHFMEWALFCDCPEEDQHGQ